VFSLDDLGWNSFFSEQVTDDERMRWHPARVVWEGREQYRLSTGEAEWRADLAGRIRHRAASRADLPAIGDWVLAALRPDDRSATIQRVLARRSRFSRAAAGRPTGEQVVAANVDVVLLVTSLNRDFNLRRIERYLSLAWDSGATPVVVLNKADLCPDPESWRHDMASAALAVPVLVTSALRGDGMAALMDVVRSAGTTALLGSSGVGKSTLINALVGEERQSVRPIREHDERGRHGTTSRQLICLTGGGILIDTPGMRELQLWDAENGLEHAFGDVETLASACRFRDCSHGGEPGCAVTAAVERGEIAADRLASYQRLQREDDFVRSRHDGAARSERTRKVKQLSKAAKRFYKMRKRGE
jgi:ribosome biogenesis GTPase